MVPTTSSFSQLALSGGGEPVRRRKRGLKILRAVVRRTSRDAAADLTGYGRKPTTG